MAQPDRSRSPARRPPAPLDAPRFPCFPRRHGPVGTSIRMVAPQFRPQVPRSWPMSQSMVSNFSQLSNMMMNPSQSFPPSPPPSFRAMSPPTPCSPTQPCPATPSQSSNSPTPMTTTPQQCRNLQPTQNPAIKEYGFDLNEQWHQDADFYDNQKLNGLTFPRMIKTSAFTSSWTLKDVILSSYHYRLCCTNNTTITG